MTTKVPFSMLKGGGINALDYGATGDGVTNDTAAMQAALTAAAGGTLVIPKPVSKYVVGALTVPSNIRVVLEPGTILESNATLLTGTQKCLNIAGANVHIVGYGATVQMVKAGFSSEYNHCVSVDQASGQIDIQGLSCNDSGGDGFYIKSPLANVTLRDCRASNNRRQGLSLVEAKSFNDYRGVYIGTTGTAPSAGVDIEPNGASDVLGPVRFYGTQTSGNDASGFLVYLNAWNSVTNVADIVFQGCKSRSNAQSTASGLNRMAGFEVRRIGDTTPCTGRIAFIDCVSEDDGYAGFRCQEKAKTGPQVDIIRPVVYAANRNASSTSGEDSGIALYTPGTYTSAPGGVLIDSPRVIQKSGGSMTYAVHVSSNTAKGHADVLIQHPKVVGTFAASSPVTVSADERAVRVVYASPTYRANTTSATLTDGRWLGQVLTNAGASGAITLTLPAATADRVGWQFTFAVNAAQQLNVAPGAGDQIYPYGSGAADPVSSSTVGSRITLEVIGANVWHIVNQSGTWA